MVDKNYILWHVDETDISVITHQTKQMLLGRQAYLHWTLPPNPFPNVISHVTSTVKPTGMQVWRIVCNY